MSLTINQEKRIRAEKAGDRTALREHDEFKALRAQYETLARTVLKYRLAQKNTGPGGADVRQKLIAEIDQCLEVLGV